MNLYTSKKIRELDRLAIKHGKLSSYKLMCRAGEAAYRLLKKKWPKAKTIFVVCGLGNNAGDGLVVARLAREDGKQVFVQCLGNPKKLQGAAKEADVIVDAIFGTGLDRTVEGDFAKAIQDINTSGKPVFSLDIPSGLSADTGAVLGCAVRASATITFIGHKQGLYTADGPDCSGDIHFDDLKVSRKIFDGVNSSAKILEFDEIKKIPKRKKNSHKGNFGRVLIVGGDEGMVGATFLSGEAALRTGAGLVTLCVKNSPGFDKRQERPELIIHSSEKLESLLEEATVIAVGPGLGQSEQSKAILQKCLRTKKPLVVDADALNLLAKSRVKKENWILTPHPGEASRLLKGKDIHRDRFSVVREIQKIYGGVVVLKGCGTLICEDFQKPIWICREGNPDMATAGMGDVLTGVIAALLGQGLSLKDAACLGVCLHARAGDLAAKKSGRGLIAGDLFKYISSRSF